MGTFLQICVILFLASAAWAVETCQDPVTITSSTAGTQVAATIGGGLTAYLKDGSVGAVWIARVPGGSCPTSMTNDMGYRLSRDAGDPDYTGYDFIPRRDGYTGPVCAILESGSTSVDICRATW